MTFLQNTLGRNYKWWYIILYRFRVSTTYRWSSFIWSLGRLVILGFTLLLWKLNIDAGSNLFSFKQIFTYYIAGSIFLLDNEVNGILSWQIKDGKLNNKLIQPTNPLLQYFFLDTGWQIFNWIIEAIIISCVALIGWNNLILPTIENFLLFMIFALIAFIIKLYFGYLIGLLAFFLVSVDSLIEVQNDIIRFLSGQSLPLNTAKFLLPLTQLPFAFMYYYPMQVWFGEIKGWDLVNIIGLSLFWILVLHIIVLFVYKKGLKKYEAVGL
jgi:ABC-2 type transport system permease protein